MSSELMSVENMDPHIPFGPQDQSSPLLQHLAVSLDQTL